VEDGVVLWVEDDGPGVDAAEAEGLFARHRRGSRSVTDGWGLGLAIVRTLVEAHGGRVGYARSPSGGARFELWLPSACHRDADSRECGDGDGAVGRG
jgi:signal transduction histidine kinase